MPDDVGNVDRSPADLHNEYEEMIASFMTFNVPEIFSFHVSPKEQKLFFIKLLPIINNS